MEENRTQQIAPSPIRMVAKKVDCLKYDGGKPTSDQETIRGKFNVSNSITNKVESEEGTLLYANLRLTVDPENGFNFYAIDLSVSGMFAKLDSNLSDDEFERAVLTDGISELYAFARNMVDAVTRDGVFETMSLPLLEFRI